MAAEQPETLTLEQLGLRFPAVGLDGIGDSLVAAVAASWRNLVSGAARNACVLVAGGASGTGKTRFGSVLPQVLLAATQRCAAHSPAAGASLAELRRALEQCVARQLVLQMDAPFANTDSATARRLLEAYFSPPATASGPRFDKTTTPQVVTVNDAWATIARCERAWRPHDGPIAVIVHLDEVQKLLVGTFTEANAAALLGTLVHQLAAAVWSDRSVALFPIFYVSGLSKTLVLRTASSDPPIPVNLPLLTADLYVDILRSLFGLPNVWTPPEPLARALRCIEGPPRLLLVLLWAMQASGRAEEGQKIFGTEMDCGLLSASLKSLSWRQSAAVLYRCLDALESGRLVTFATNIREGSEQLELFHNLAALVLLSQPVALHMPLAPGVSVNEAVALGFAQAQAVKGEPNVCRLHWPRIYIWALAKVRVGGVRLMVSFGLPKGQWCKSNLDGMPIPAPDAATTPTPRMITEDAWRYNEDADIKLLCLRLFALQQRARLMPGDPASRRVRLGELLPCMDDIDNKVAAAAAKLGQVVVRFAVNHVVRAEVLSTALLPETLPGLLAVSALPFAAINKERTSYADSILLLELDGPAPSVCCPANVAVGERTTRTYKTIAPEHRNLLAVLLQSKHHRDPDSAHGEVFVKEYAKCINTPIPFIFVLISDAPHVTHQMSLSWPYNGNGYFVGRDQLQQFYGDFLYHIREEAWLPK